MFPFDNGQINYQESFFEFTAQHTAGSKNALFRFPDKMEMRFATPSPLANTSTTLPTSHKYAHPFFYSPKYLPLRAFLGDLFAPELFMRCQLLLGKYKAIKSREKDL